MLSLSTGQLVRSLQGGDRGKFYAVVEEEQGRILLWDGKRYRVGRWKKKNPKHLQVVLEDPPSLRELVSEALHLARQDRPESARGQRILENRRLELDAQVRHIIKQQLVKTEEK